MALANSDNKYDSVITLNLYRENLDWWRHHIFPGSISLRPIDYSIKIFYDASLSCSGAEYSINCLNLKAPHLSLKCFAKKKNIDILLRIDNMTAISYINRMCSIQFQKSNSIAREI